MTSVVPSFTAFDFVAASAMLDAAMPTHPGLLTQNVAAWASAPEVTAASSPPRMRARRGERIPYEEHHAGRFLTSPRAYPRRVCYSRPTAYPDPVSRISDESIRHRPA